MRTKAEQNLHCGDCRSVLVGKVAIICCDKSGDKNPFFQRRMAIVNLSPTEDRGVTIGIVIMIIVITGR